MILAFYDKCVDEDWRSASAAMPTQDDLEWQRMYNRLCEYKKVHGDCCVPENYAEDPELGRWVALQKMLISTLDE